MIIEIASGDQDLLPPTVDPPREDILTPETTGTNAPTMTEEALLGTDMTPPGMEETPPEAEMILPEIEDMKLVAATPSQEEAIPVTVTTPPLPSPTEENLLMAVETDPTPTPDTPLHQDPEMILQGTTPLHPAPDTNREETRDMSREETGLVTPPDPLKIQLILN